MSSRRDFIKVTALGAAVLPLHQTFGFGKLFENKPIVVSTWTNLKANTAAWAVLPKGGRSLDAVEQVQNGIVAMHVLEGIHPPMWLLVFFWVKSLYT